MITTPEFVAAEVAYRTQRLTEDYRAVRRHRKRRAFLHLPRFSAVSNAERIRARSLASG
jgi:predicted nucleic acid-binding protein